MAREWRMVTAESCTGGWIAKCCTDMAGSSAWFDRGYITYSYAAKEDMLGVSHDELVKYGAVSEQVARQMVMGAKTRSKQAVVVSATGIAGPGGGARRKWASYRGKECRAIAPTRGCAADSDQASAVRQLRGNDASSADKPRADSHSIGQPRFSHGPGPTETYRSSHRAESSRS